MLAANGSKSPPGRGGSNFWEKNIFKTLVGCMTQNKPNLTAKFGSQNVKN